MSNYYTANGTPASDTTLNSGYGPSAALPDGLINPGGSVTPTVPITTATYAPTVSNAGKRFVLSVASGSTVTLPAATGSGATYIFVVGTTVTSNADVIVTTSGDYINGTILQAGASNATDAWVTTASTNTTITLNGTTKGGLIGDYIEYVDIGLHQWLVYGIVGGSGTRATPIT